MTVKTPQKSQHSHHWQLNPEVTFLNHGSFGAAPICVLQAQRQHQDLLERDPIMFLGPERELRPKLDHVRRRLADFVNAEASDIVFVRNATDGVNAVVRSIPFKAGDEIIVTNHGYNACNNAAEFAARRAGGLIRVANVPFPLEDSQQVVDAIGREFTNATKLLLVDHVTSPTGLVFPLKRIIELAKSRGVLVLVDAAHAAGMLQLDVADLDADFYTANHHKWLCGPKASGFLWVKQEHQKLIRPTVISHGANRPLPDQSQFQTEFDWVGTYDPTPILAMDQALEFLSSLTPQGHPQLMRENHLLAVAARKHLLEHLAISSPAPLEMIGTMVAVPLAIPPEKALLIKQRLWKDFRIEVPVFHSTTLKKSILRTSSFAYNCDEQYQYLCESLRKVIDVIANV